MYSDPIWLLMFKRLGVSEDSNLTSSPVVVVVVEETVESETTPAPAPAPTPKPKRKSRFEPEPAAAPAPKSDSKRKDGKWDMFAEADNFGGHYNVSTFESYKLN